MSGLRLAMVTIGMLGYTSYNFWRIDFAAQVQSGVILDINKKVSDLSIEVHNIKERPFNLKKE